MHAQLFLSAFDVSIQFDLIFSATQKQTIKGDDGEVAKIGMWLNNQRSRRSTLTAERRELLEALNGFEWPKKRKKKNETEPPAKKRKKKNKKKMKPTSAQEKARVGGSVDAGVAKPRPRGHPGGKESKKFRAITLTETFEEEAMHEETMSGEEVTVADFRGLDSNLVDLDRPPPPPPPEKSEGSGSFSESESDDDDVPAPPNFPPPKQNEQNADQGRQTGMEVDKAITEDDLFTSTQDFRDNAPTSMPEEDTALLTRVTERWLNGTSDNMAVD